MSRKSRRRGNGEGSPYKRSDGQWCVALRVGGVGGRRIVRYGRTRDDVMLKLDQSFQLALIPDIVRFGFIPRKAKRNGVYQSLKSLHQRAKRAIITCCCLVYKFAL